MNKIKKLFKLLVQSPNEILAYIFMKCAVFLPDRPYLKILFRLKMGYKLDIDNPKTYNEKIQWLKLYNRRPEYINMVDKFEAKKYVAQIIGDQYIIPTYGIWKRFDEINFNSLPEQFVLKTTNGGGGSGVVICKEKKSFDKVKARKTINHSLKSNIYRNFREWPYKGIKPLIIAEKYMEDLETKELRDYKFFCFDGYVDCVMVCSERNTGNVKFYYFDRDWNFKRMGKISNSAPKDFTLKKPINLDEMFAIAEQLSKNIPFVRVDLYSVNGKTYFSELTFFSDSGYDKDNLPETNEYWGKLIKIK